MQYLVIEKFKKGKVKQVYERFEEKGRMLPDGLHFISSWISEDVTVCYQIMETDDVKQLHHWIGTWGDLVDFEVIPVISSQQAKEKIFKTNE